MFAVGQNERITRVPLCMLEGLMTQGAQAAIRGL
jgi:hypothetical protein